MGRDKKHKLVRVDLCSENLSAVTNEHIRVFGYDSSALRVHELATKGFQGSSLLRAFFLFFGVTALPSAFVVSKKQYAMTIDQKGGHSSRFRPSQIPYAPVLTPLPQMPLKSS